MWQMIESYNSVTGYCAPPPQLYTNHFVGQISPILLGIACAPASAQTMSSQQYWLGAVLTSVMDF
jgi:hypothetical protein